MQLGSIPSALERESPSFGDPSYKLSDPLLENLWTKHGQSGEWKELSTPPPMTVPLHSSVFTLQLKLCLKIVVLLSLPWYKEIFGLEFKTSVIERTL